MTTETDATPRRRRIWKFLLLALCTFLVVLAAIVWYATTDAFQARVRRRFVAELERISGGRVEVGGLHTIPFRLQVDVRDMTIHGREGPDEVPLVHVDRLVARVKVISVLGAEVGFHSVILDHPVVHIIVYPDGTINHPRPKLSASPTTPVMEQLFRLRIGHLEVNQGELLWNDQKIPFDSQVEDLSADVNYSLIHDRYDGHFSVGKINSKYGEYRPVAWKGEAQFSLEPDAVDLKSLSIISGKSHLQASGRISNFSQPQFVGQYEATVDLTEAASILRYSQLRRGLLQLSGHGTWTSQVFSANGKLLLSGVEWRDRSLALRTVDLSTQFAADPKRLVLSSLQTNAFGGDIRGDADVFNWLNPAPINKRGNSSDQQKGTVRLKIKDLSVRELALAVSSLRPLREAGLMGYASGTIETRWKGSPNYAESEVSFDVAPPNRPSPGQSPLRAHGHAIYRQASGELELAEFNAITRATQLRASGTLSRRAALRISVTSDDLSEWERVFPVLETQPGNPIMLRGSASFVGTAAGQLREPTLAGRLQLENFKMIFSPSAGAAKQQIRGDALTGDVQLSPHNIALHHGRLHAGGSVFHFHFNAALNDWEFAPESSFTASLSTENANVLDALSVANLQYPLTGELTLSLDANGTRAQPEGQGSVLLTNASIQGKPLKQVESKFSLLGSQVSLQDIRLIYLDADVAGSGSYDFSTRQFRFDLRGHNFDLASIPALQQGPLPIDGRVDFDAQTSGTPEAPAINATLHLRQLFIGHQHVGDYTFNAVTHGANLQLHGRSQFKEAELNIDGNVLLREQWPSDFNLEFSHLDVNPLLRIYLRQYVTGGSEAAGDVHLHGPLRNLRQLQVTSNVSDFFADLEHVQIRNNGPIRFAFSGQTLTVEELRLVGEDTDLTVAGTVNVGEEQQLALHAEGHADLALLHSFNSDFTSSGAIAVNVSLDGTISHPEWKGNLQIAGGSIQYADLPSALSDINGKLVFNQDRLQVETLKARVGGGVVTFGGYATEYHRELTFDLTLNGQDVRLRYPQGVSSMTNAQLRWTGTSTVSTISGDATLTKLAVTPGFDFGSYLVSSAQTVALPQTNPLLSRISLDVHIVTTPELQMQTAALRLSGNADLRLRGSAAKPVLLGRADIIEGQIYFNGAKYRLERGDITFTNPVTTTPFLDLQASTRVRDYDITLTLNGQVDKLKLNYRSEPPLSQADIVSLLAVGQTQEQYSQTPQAVPSPLMNQASSAVLAEAINNALSNRSQRLFGISHIKVDPQGINTETTPVQPTPIPAVTIEQQVKENITLTYTTNVAQTSQQIIQGEYNISRDLMIVGIRDYNGVVSFELRIRQRKR
jgi:translocation and assembly module TamB